MAEDQPILTPPDNKAYGVPCEDISGHRKVALFHPSKIDTKLTYCSDAMPYILDYGFEEDTESSTEDTIHFKYVGGQAKDAAEESSTTDNPTLKLPKVETAEESSTTENPTLKLPRLKIDGLHPYTYQAFLTILNHYLQSDKPETLFRVRYAAVEPEDFERTWFLAEVNDKPIVYVKDSLDIEDFNKYHDHEGDLRDEHGNKYPMVVLRSS